MAGHRSGLRATVVAATVLSLVLTTLASPSRAAPPDAGELVFYTSSDQLGKPHRLTWFAEDRWWAVLRKSNGSGSGWRVWRRDADGTWTFGSEVLSTTGADRFDAFLNPDDGRVFVHHLNSSQSRLLRLEYDPGSDMFVRAATANVPTAYAGQVASLTVDTVGRVWIATHPDGRLTYTVRDADTLAEITPSTVLPDRVEAESLVVGRFVDDAGPAVGFVYAEDTEPYRGTFRIQRDADPVGRFTTEVFAEQVDNHATFAAAGVDLVVVWKDERNVVGEPIVLVRRRHPDGRWGDIVEVFTAKSTRDAGNHTRPRIVIDAENRRVHVAAAENTASAQEVHERVADIDTLGFGPQRVIFRSGDDRNGHVFRDVHAGQQPVTAASGLLWLARGRDVIDSQQGSFSLWQHHLAIADPDGDPPPVEPGSSVAITSSHPPVVEGSTVTVTAAVSGPGTAKVDWGDGTVTTESVTDGVLSATQTYPDDGLFTIVVSIDDGQGGSAADRVVQQVVNAAPTITSDSGDVTVQVDDPFAFEVDFEDPGILDTHTVSFDFGDGTTAIQELSEGERSASAIHRYAAGGTAAITVTVTDSDGGSDTVTRTATVQEPDPDLEVVELTIAPTTASVLVGDLQPFTATATYSDASARVVTDVAVWSSSDAAVAAIDDAGQAVGVGAGTATINASYSGRTAGATLTVTTVPPSAQGVTVTTAKDTPVTVELRATHPHVCELDFAVMAGPGRGTLGALQDQPCTTGSPNSDRVLVTYMPEPGFTGADEFTFVAHDGTTASEKATVSVLVRPAGVVFRGGSVASAEGGSSLVVARPVQAEPGDVLVASVTVSGKAQVSPPDGWELVRSDSGGNAVAMVSFVRVIGDGEPEQYRWELSTSTSATGQVLAYGGVDAHAPVVANAGRASGPRSVSLTAPSVTTTVDGARLVALFGVATATTISVAEDLDARTHVASSGGVTAAAGDVVQDAAGVSASYTAQLADGGRGIGQLLALRPAQRS
jgi:hypothetical protein